MKNLLHMMKLSWFQLFSGIVIVSFLLFFVNILSMASYQMSVSRDQIQEKLGVYFYLDEGNKQSKDVAYAKTIELIHELEEAELNVTFYSKEDAFGQLAKRLPNVIGSLEKYNISNPLPPTIYVLFDTHGEYETLKTIVSNYQDVVLNLDEVAGKVSFEGQQHRVATVINMLNFLELVGYFLIMVTVLIAITFLLYAIRINFFRFHKQIEVEKLLGAGYTTIISPFLLYVVVILLCAFLLTGSYIWFLYRYLDGYISEVFSTSLASFVPDIQTLGLYIVLQVAVVLVLMLLFASISLFNQLRRV